MFSSEPTRSRAAVLIKKVFDTIKDSILDPNRPSVLPVRKLVFDCLDFPRRNVVQVSGSNLLHDGSSSKAGSLGSFKCSKCLATGHSRSDCRFRVCFKACFAYGHKARYCLAQSKKKALTKWVVKGSTENIGTKQVTSVVSSPAPSLPQAKRPLLIQSAKPTSPKGRIDQSSAPMADVQFNLARFTPPGLHLQEGSPFRLPRADLSVEPPTRRHECYKLAEVEPAIHEDIFDVHRIQIRNHL